MGTPRLDVNRPCRTCNKKSPEVEFYFTIKGCRFPNCKACTYKLAKIRDEGLGRRQKNRRPGRSVYNTDRPCTQCGKGPLEVSFGLKRNGYRQSVCNLCNTENVRIWCSKNKDKVSTQRAFRKHRRRALVRSTEGHYTSEEWNKMKMFYDFTCLSCKRREPEIKLTLDHVIPISKGGSNLILNIQPLCGSCNSHKHVNVTDYRLTKPWDHIAVECK